MERILPQEPRRNQDALCEAVCEAVGPSLMARAFDRQMAEVQIRTAVLSGYTEFGISITVPVG